MIKKFMTQSDVVDTIKQQTGFFKKDIQVVIDALDDIIIDNMRMATVDEPSEIKLFHGWKLGGKRLPERPYRDPRNGQSIVTPEKVVPYCQFKLSIRQRINQKNVDNLEVEDELYE